MRPPACTIPTVIAAPLAGLLLCQSGCTAPRSVGFDDRTPSGRLRAISAEAEAARAPAYQRDPQTLRQLVISLGSDDPAERMLASATLERITGETHGYMAYASLAQRQEAIDRWIDWLRAEGLAEGPTVLWSVDPQPDAAQPTVQERPES